MTLDEARERVGLLVVYRPPHRLPAHLDEGVITSVNERYVFVRYGTQQASQATNVEDLIPLPAMRWWR